MISLTSDLNQEKKVCDKFTGKEKSRPKTAFRYISYCKVGSAYFGSLGLLGPF